MKIKTIYTKAVLKDYQTYLFTKGIKRLRYIELTLLVVLFLYNLLFVGRSILYPMLYLIAVMVVLETFMRFRTWKRFISENETLLNHEVAYDFQEEQVHIISSTSDVLIRYANLKKLVETNTCLFLFESKENAYLVNKEFISVDQLQFIRDSVYRKRVSYHRKKFRFM